MLNWKIVKYIIQQAGEGGLANAAECYKEGEGQFFGIKCCSVIYGPPR